jgi:uracil-DNA glycosylase
MADIALIGEAWGEVEERERRAFVGTTGYELDRMLKQAGISRRECLLTNVFNFRPPNNKIEAICGPVEDKIPGYPALLKGKYVHRQYAGELNRLADELEACNPNVVITLGNTATWALLGKTMISKLRGVTSLSTHTYTGLKVLPTYHPAAIFRQWSLRPVTIIDLIKALRESEYPEIRRPEREIWIEPTLEDLYEFDQRYIQHCERLAVDIETAGQCITLIGLSPSPDLALVIPGIGYQRAGRAYWGSLAVERRVYNFIKEIMSRPVGKVFQNGLYDIAFIWRAWKIRVMNAEEDTMLLHHALQPESLKSLGFLGSIYTDEGPWKQMREVKTIKRED